MITGALRRFADIEVLGAANAAPELSAEILRLHPELFLLDLSLPEERLARLLSDLRENYPAPIVGCASHSRRSAGSALGAIERGVVDVVIMPRECRAHQLVEMGDDLARKIRDAVAAARPVYPRRTGRPGQCVFSFHDAGVDPTRHLIVVGASTGGPEALREFLANMPADSPGIAIVQHMPAMFTGPFAKRLDAASLLSVSEAVDGDQLRPGRAVVARGDTHLTVRGRIGSWRVCYTDRKKVNRHCPSVDVLFDSAVEAVGENAIGVILTGMGADGAAGLLRLRRQGALTLGQDSRSCVVFGMPKAAQNLGAVEIVGPPDRLPELMLRALASRCRRPAMR